MPSITQLREEIEAKRTNLHNIFAAYDDVTKIPADEAKKIKPMNDELTQLSKDLEAAEELQGIKSSVGKPRSTPEVAQNGRSDGGSTAPAVKSFAEILRASDSYKSFRERGGGTAVIELSGAESKTLMTLTTINNQATRMPGIQPSIQDETTVSDLVAQGSTDNNAMTYMEETTFTNATTTVDEGGLKPESALAFTERTDNVRKLATWIPATTELLSDVSGIQSYIEGRLTFMIRRKEEDQILNGDGTAPNISGILDRAIQSQAKGTDPTPDAFYKAITKVRVTGQAEPDAFVIHPNDWQEIRLLRTADGVYIWGSPAEAGPERMWGLNARITSVIAENTGLVGAFRAYAQKFQREGITLKISTEHSDYFVYNKVAILAEERLALAVYRPYAFCQVTGI